MESHFLNFMSQWFMYLLPSIALFIRKRMGKPLLMPLGFCVVWNLLLGWTVVVWILLMLNAFGINPVPWMAMTTLKLMGGFAGGGGPVGVPMGADDGGSGGRTPCGQCGGSGTVTCSHCQGRGSWYTQPTSAHEVSQLQTCSYCISSGRIRCPNCGGVRG